MAQIQNQIDPLDLTPSVGVGVALPFNGPGVFNTNYTTKDQTKSNLINLVLTEPGERIYKPFFGVGLNSLLFEQNIQKEELKIKIQEAISRDSRLNRITISNVNIDRDINTNTIKITIEYISRLDGSNDAIQIGIGEISEGGPAPYETKENNY
jgi:phage baseplate assembly protein W